MADAYEYGYGTNTGNLLTTAGKNVKEYKDYIKNYLHQDMMGNNELGVTFKRAAFGLTPDFLARVGFMNEIGPQRLQAIRNYINMFSPGQQQGMVDQNRARLMHQGNQAGAMAQARLAGMGASKDAQMGAALAAQSQAASQANAYQNQFYSPEGQMSVLQGLMGAYGQSQDLNLQNLLPLFQAIETRHVQNEAEAAANRGGGLGGMLGGVLGSVLPGINMFNSIKGMAGGGGGGSNASSGGGGLPAVSPSNNWSLPVSMPSYSPYQPNVGFGYRPY
jgi:hypothetical protein